jgi:hypothetical protein
METSADGKHRIVARRRMPLESPGEITLVTVEFIPYGDESELVVTHERFTKPDLAQRYETGWGTIAKKFAAYLADRRNQQAAAATRTVKK